MHEVVLRKSLVIKMNCKNPPGLDMSVEFGRARLEGAGDLQTRTGPNQIIQTMRRPLGTDLSPSSCTNHLTITLTQGPVCQYKTSASTRILISPLIGLNGFQTWS